MSETLAWPIALGVLGALLGSFIATLAIRWPAGRSVLRGRSACDGCGRTLRAIELVPLVSALALRGRCRGCHRAIDPRHGWIELAAAAIGASAGIATASPTAIAGAAFGWLLLALAALDVVALWLPDRLTGLLALGGIGTAALGLYPALPDRLIGGAAGFASLWLIALGYRRWRGREGLGGGDPKLFGAIGLWLGWEPLPAVLLIASMVGLGIALVARLAGNRVAADTPVPLGALLAIAAYPAWLVMIASSR